MICEQCKKELALKKGYTRIWECDDCQVTYYMTYGISKIGR